MTSVVNINRSSTITMIVRGDRTAEVLMKTPSPRVTVVQSASPIPVSQGLPVTIDGGNF